jgi:hypothetical protein
MREFNNIEFTSVNSNTNLLLDNIPEYITEDYDLFDEKDMKKYIDDVKKSARTSYEYQAMIGYLKENMDMRRCAFLENVENYGNGCKVKIELHHHPFTIEDIIRIVFKKRQAYHENLEVEMTAKEVMYLHYNLMVGLIPLSLTPHQLLHNNYIFIPNDKVYGNYKKFVNLYYDFIEPETLDMFDRLEEITDADNTAHYTVLSQNRIYLTPTGEYEVPNLNNLKTMLENRLTDLRNEDETGSSAKKPINPFIHFE